MGRSSWLGFQIWSLLQLSERSAAARESRQACMYSSATAGGQAITVSSACATGMHCGKACKRPRGSASTSPKVRLLMGSPCGIPAWVVIKARRPRLSLHDGRGRAVKPGVMDHSQRGVRPLQGIQRRLPVNLFERVANVGANVYGLLGSCLQVALHLLGHAYGTARRHGCVLGVPAARCSSGRNAATVTLASNLRCTLGTAIGLTAVPWESL